MLVRKARNDAPSWCTRNEAKLQQVWLIHILNRLGVFAGAGCQCIQPNRPAVELLDDRQQQIAVGLIETDMINLQRVQRRLSDFARNHAIGLHLGIVTHALEQAIDDAWRATSAASNFLDTSLICWR